MPSKKTTAKNTVQNTMYDLSDLPMKANFPNPFAPQILSEAIKISRIGHTFTKIPDELLAPGEPSQYIVQNYLIDQTGFTGAAKMRVPFRAKLNQYGQYRIQLLPKGYNGIRVNVPDGNIVYFSSQLLRRSVNPPGGGDFYDASPATVRFTQLSAAAPIITYNNFSITHATNLSLGFSIEGQVNNSFSFYDLIMKGSYAPRHLAPANATYNAFSYALPFGLPGQHGVAFVMFAYITTNSIDPGPFVKIF